jgi:hypothetical protein
MAETVEVELTDDERADMLSAAGSRVAVALRALYRVCDGDEVAVGEVLYECNKAARGSWDTREVDRELEAITLYAVRDSDGDPVLFEDLGEAKAYARATWDDDEVAHVGINLAGGPRWWEDDPEANDEGSAQ